jgi:hypothetical protein
MKIVSKGIVSMAWPPHSNGKGAEIWANLVLPNGAKGQSLELPVPADLISEFEIGDSILVTIEKQAD